MGQRGRGKGILTYQKSIKYLSDKRCNLKSGCGLITEYKGVSNCTTFHQNDRGSILISQDSFLALPIYCILLESCYVLLLLLLLAPPLVTLVELHSAKTQEVDEIGDEH